MNKKLVFNHLSMGLILLLCFTSSIVGVADLGEYTKTIKKEFVINANGTTSISNKYGKVEVKTWDKNRVKIDVTIAVKARNEDAAKMIFDRIDIAFSNDNDFVRAATSIEQKSKGWWPSRSKENIDYAINYEVYLPATNNLDLSHRYGEIMVEDLQGQGVINSKYANFTIGSLGDNSEIVLAYGNGSIEKAENLKLDVSYGKLAIDKMKNAKISSKYTTVEVKEANMITSYSKYDDYNLGKISSFKNEGQYDNINIKAADAVEVQSKYTQFLAAEVQNSLNLDFKYGNANCSLAPSCSEVMIQGNYTDFNLGITSGLSSNVEAVATYAGIRYPREMQVSFEKDRGNAHEVKGKLGNNSNQGSIKARLSYGSLKIVMKE